MNRRGHLSSKVPQVKLRPAPAKSRARKEPSPISEYDRQFMDGLLAQAEDDETADAKLKNDEKPWKGVTFTITNVDEKNRIIPLAQQLGATYESALTRGVTHLVAGSFTTAKYLHAVEHQIPVMFPSWIDDAHETWIAGGDVDFERDVQEHRIPPFLGLRISLTSVEPTDRRKLLIRYIEAHGGFYSKDLDRNCTHLVTAKPATEKRPSEKVKWAMQENERMHARHRMGKSEEGEHEIKIVYEEWLWDCVAWEGRWAEDYYDARIAKRRPRMDVEEFIKGQFVLPGPDRKPSIENAPAQPQTTLDPSEPAAVRKRKGEGLDSLVSDLLSTAGPSSSTSPGPGAGPIAALRTHTRPLRGSPLVKRLGDDLDNEGSGGEGEAPLAKRVKAETSKPPSVLHLSRQASFAEKTGEPARPGKGRMVKAEKTEEDLPEGDGGPAAEGKEEAGEGEGEGKGEGEGEGQKVEDEPIVPMFEGLVIGHLVSSEWTNLEEALILHGAKVLPKEKVLAGEKLDFCVVRLAKTTYGLRLGNLDITTLPFVTECFIEACIDSRKLLDPDSERVYRPLSIAIPIPGADKLFIHVSGPLKQKTDKKASSLWHRRLVLALGAHWEEEVSERTTTHLISFKNNGAKVNAAVAMGINILKYSWVVAMAESGVVEPVEGHLMEIPDREVKRKKGVALLEKVRLKAEESGKSDLGTASPNASSSGLNINRLRPIDNSASGKQIPAPPGVSQSRMLQLTPTHIDEPNGGGSGAAGSRASALSDMGMGQSVIIPKHGLLSPANSDVFKQPEPVKKGGKGKDPSPVKQPQASPSKLPRYSSAPVPHSSPLAGGRALSPAGAATGASGSTSTSTAAPVSKTLKAVKGASASAGAAAGISKSASASSLLGGKETTVTEALRQLAEKDGSTLGSGKVVRRSRPSLRANKNPIGRSPHVTLSSISPTSRRTSPHLGTGPDEYDTTRSEMEEALQAENAVAEESIQIKYVDEKALRERRKLMAMYDAGGGGEEGVESGAGGGGGGGGSKRAKRR
ncbi:hypothetical protein IAT38_000297 [Cryptococcus sp. DSM 104549]